jgi:hypothetical protein
VFEIGALESRPRCSLASVSFALRLSRFALGEWCRAVSRRGRCRLIRCTDWWYIFRSSPPGRRTRSSLTLNPVLFNNTHNTRIIDWWFQRENVRERERHHFQFRFRDSILSQRQTQREETTKAAKRRDENERRTKKEQREKERKISLSLCESSTTKSMYLTRAVHHLKMHLSFFLSRERRINDEKF